MKSAGQWVLIGFFFFGGLAFALWEQTSWIGLGQIWMGVALFLAFVNLGLFGKLREKLRGKTGA